MNEESTPNDVSRRTVLRAGAAGVGTLGVVGSAAGDGDEYDDEPADDREPDPEPEPAVVTETADVVGQGPDGPVVAENGATIHRTEHELLISLSMPTPEPGSYTYPSEPPEREGEWWTDEVGELEAFSLWAFVFDHPDECVDGCDSEDLGEPAGGGVFAVTGHVFDGPDLTLNGTVSRETDLYEEDGEPMGLALERPMEAEVHLAVAPHGAFAPAMMPEILQTPTGPGPDVWWSAIFD